MSKHDELTRRSFVASAAKSYLGVSLAPFLGSALTSNSFGQVSGIEGGTAQSVIFLNMSGGMSHIDTFDPKPKQKKIQGPVEVIDTNVEGIQLTEYLRQTAKHADKMCIINSMSSRQGAHEQGQYQMHRGYAPRGTIVHPTMGSWALKMKGKGNPGIPGFVSIGGPTSNASPGFFGAKYGGVPIGKPEDGLKNIARPSSVSNESFQKRLALADVLNQNFHEQFQHPMIGEYNELFEEALRIMKSEDIKAFDVTKESDSMKEKYGKNHFGLGCLLARRLVEHKVRFVEVTLGGWDSHYDNFSTVEARCQILDKAYSALLQDLASRGLLESTLVVLSTEFGRTPEIVENHQLGRDHYPSAYSSVLAGGGINGGEKYGLTDSKGAKVKEDAVSQMDINATIAYALGINHKNILTSPSGRPFSMGNKGQPLEGLFKKS